MGAGVRVSAGRRWRRVLKRMPGLHRGVIALRRRRLVRDLRLLYDVLAETPLAGRYWLNGGALLGWAREGRLLAHDLEDVDFAYLAQDRWAFEAALPAIDAAGFWLKRVWRNRWGVITEEQFHKGGAQYDFFVMTPHDGKLRFYGYGQAPGTDQFYELVGDEDDQPVVPFEFLGRSWLKHADHDAELTAHYGDWHTPDPNWQYFHDHCIIERHPRPELRPTP